MKNTKNYLNVVSDEYYPRIYKDLKKYNTFLELQKISHIDFIDRASIQQCLGYLHDNGASAKSLARFISTIRILFL